jgi:4-hydroxy-tetrahydrodipicolinate synthase
MAAPKEHRGVVVPMVSPVTAEGDLDEQGTRRLVDHLVNGGVDGFMVLGTNGEGPSLSLPHRQRLVEIGVEQAGRRARVYVGVGGTCVSESVALGRDALDRGADGVVAHLPPYFPLSPGEMVAFYRHLAERIDGPLFIYNMPPTTHMSIPMECLEELSDDPRIVGLKDSEKDLDRLKKVLDTFRERPDFAVFVGAAVLASELLACGADGVVPSSGNLVPGPWGRLVEAVRDGQTADARELQETLDRVAQAYQRGRTLGQGIAALKASVAAQGLCGPWVLPPLRPLDEEEQRSLREELATLGVV